MKKDSLLTRLAPKYVFNRLRRLHGGRISLGPLAKNRERRMESIRVAQLEAIEMAKYRREHQLAGTMPKFRHEIFHNFRPIKGCEFCKTT